MRIALRVLRFVEMAGIERRKPACGARASSELRPKVLSERESERRNVSLVPGGRFPSYTALNYVINYIFNYVYF